MTVPSVLVVGSPANSTLDDIVFEAGLTPVFRETILTAIAALRKTRFLAVVVDDATADVDVLELILNIRDMDPRIRIFVLPGKNHKLGRLEMRRHVSVVNRKELLHKLTPTVVPVTEYRSRRSQRPPQPTSRKGGSK